MAKILRFFRLPASNRKILVRAGVLLWVVRIGLWLLPFHTLRNLLSKRSKRTYELNRIDSLMVEKIVTSVSAMSRYVPAATCLTQALVALAMFEEAGLPASLRIGVAKDEVGKLEAHAWVESEGRVVIGGRDADLSRFTILHAVEGT